MSDNISGNFEVLSRLLVQLRLQLDHKLQNVNRNNSEY